MVKKRIWKQLAATCLTVLMLGGAAPLGAFALDLVPVGKAVGIEMRTQGVLVAALSTVETAEGQAKPAADAGVMPGDIIVKLGAADISTADDFIGAVGALDGTPVALTLNRNGKQVQYTVTPAQDVNGGHRLGLILRDGISGIGTVTFYDPETGLYGALGHAINDADTGTMLPVGNGSITNATVSDVQKGAQGAPGRLGGVFDVKDIIGTIDGNTAFGIFGTMNAAPQGEAITVAEPEEIKTGAATILAQVDGSDTREFGVEISRVYLGDSDRLMVTVTDPALLELTGGIVQGMSGCPIIQNGKLVGAVTHVLLSDPTKGYGTTISSMLRAAAETTKEAA